MKRLDGGCSFRQIDIIFYHRNVHINERCDGFIKRYVYAVGKWQFNCGIACGKRDCFCFFKGKDHPLAKMMSYLYAKNSSNSCRTTFLSKMGLNTASADVGADMVTSRALLIAFLRFLLPLVARMIFRTVWSGFWKDGSPVNLMGNDVGRKTLFSRCQR